jgi:uncharacterized repeat protein (TIGR03803 family)
VRLRRDYGGDTNGARPEAGLVLGADGNFYGTTSEGGEYHDQNGVGCGTIFRIAPDGVLTTLFSFNSAGPGGYCSWGTLASGRDGELYGTTRYDGVLTNGSISGCPAVFKIDLAGAFTVVSALDGTNAAGSNFGLVQGSDGNFYGTDYGGTNHDAYGSPFGSVYRVSANGVVTSLASFNGTNGALPRTLMAGTDGNLYGMTGLGGPDYVGPLYSDQNTGHGTVFRVTPNGVITTLVSFNVTNGDMPYGGLIQGQDGNLYGSTMSGGASGSGTIFRLSVPMPPVLRAISPTNSTVTLSWSAVAGQRYQVQYSTNLVQPNWTNLGAPCTATNGAAVAWDAVGPDPQRCYRVMVLP